MERRTPGENYFPCGDTHEQEIKPLVTVLRDPDQFMGQVFGQVTPPERGDIVPDEITISTLLGQLFQMPRDGTTSCNPTRPVCLLPQTTKQFWETPTRYCVIEDEASDRPLHAASLLPVIMGQLNSNNGKVSTFPSAICFANIDYLGNKPSIRPAFPRGILRECVVGQHNFLKRPTLKIFDPSFTSPRHNHNDLFVDENTIMLIHKVGEAVRKTAEEYSPEDWDIVIGQYAKKNLTNSRTMTN